MPPFPDTVYNIYGFLSPSEMELLYRLAAEVPTDGAILEIGSFQGKSTVCLGLGAQQSGAWVWAVDPHDEMQVNAETRYGMHNHAALLKNLVEFGVAERVRVVALPSGIVQRAWFPVIHLLWIDGSHHYEDVRLDLQWSESVAPGGVIALHDASGHHVGVSRALEELLDQQQWGIAEQVDATAVLKRAPVVSRAERPVVSETEP